MRGLRVPDVRQLKHKTMKTTDAIKLNDEQVNQIAAKVGERFTIENYGTYYNVTDTDTGERSNDGGDYNFATFNMYKTVETLYLSAIGQTHLYFDYQTSGVKQAKHRRGYVMMLKREVVRILSGFES